MTDHTIHQLNIADVTRVTGGDYVEKGLGLVYGFGLAAGMALAPWALPAACIAGAGLLAYDYWVGE